MLKNKLIFCMYTCIISTKLIGSTNFSVVYVATPGLTEVKAINASDDNGDLLSSSALAVSSSSFTAHNIVALPDATRVFFAHSSSTDPKIRTYLVDNNANDSFNDINVSGISIPLAMAATNDKVFIAEGNTSSSKRLVYIDTATFSSTLITAEVGGPGGGLIYDMVVANGKLYISTANGVRVYNATTNAFIEDVSGMTDTFTGIAASPDGTRVYVIDHTNKQLRAIETTNNTEVTTGGFPASITNTGYDGFNTAIGGGKVVNFAAGVGVAEVSDSLTKIYICEPQNDRVNVLNASTGAHITYIDTVATGRPSRIAITGDGTRGYVSNHKAENVTFINLSTDTKITDIFIGGDAFGPLGIAFRQGAVPSTPVASSETIKFINGIAKTITLSAANSDEAQLTFSTVASPGFGSLGSITQPTSGGASQTATVTYTPGNTFAESTSFTFKTTNAGTDSNTATVTLEPYLNYGNVPVN